VGKCGGRRVKLKKRGVIRTGSSKIERKKTRGGENVMHASL